VYGYSETSLTYTEAYYYDAAVSSAMYDQYGFLRSDGYSEGDSLAIVNTRTSASPGVRYDLYSNHYAKTYFYYCDYYCDSPRYYDYYGFSFLADDTFYGSYFDFCCYSYCYVYEVYIYLATTGVSITVNSPCPNLSVELRTSGGNYDPGVLNGTTQTALLGAPTTLQAIIVGGSPTGDYIWNIAGPHQASRSGNSISVYWIQPGTYEVQFRFRPNGSSCTIDTVVNINVVVPTLTEFTGSIISPPDVSSCLIAGGPPTFSLGCLAAGSSGIRFQTKIFSPQYISQNGAVKYLQIGNFDITRTAADGYGLECLSTNGVWTLDADPYVATPPETGPPDPTKANRLTSSGGETLIIAADIPTIRLEERNRHHINEQFEMYVVYYSPDTNVSRVLAYLPWSWGGDLVRNPNVFPYFDKLNVFPTDVPKTIPGIITPTIRSYDRSRILNSLDWVPCGSQTPPDPEPDPCFGSRWRCA
jgi:hypothetical protein